MSTFSGELGMDSHFVMVQDQRPVLSAETPLYDWLPEVRQLHLEAVSQLAQDPLGHMTFVIAGGVSAGKEVLTKELLKRQFSDEELREILDPYEAEVGKKISYGLMTTPMANWDASQQGRITSQIGSFTCDEVNASNEAMSKRLRDSYHQSSNRPKFDIVEMGFFGYPYWPFSAQPLHELVERTRQDPHAMLKVAFIVPQRIVQDGGMEIRETIATSPAEAETVAKNQKVVFDVALDSDTFTRSWGNHRARRLHDVFGDKDAVKRQSEIREGYDATLPKFSYADLQNDDELRVRVHMARMRMVAEEEFHIFRKDYVVVENVKITDKNAKSEKEELRINYNRNYAREFYMVDVPW